ncbi:LPS export ABC transporter permease LptF [Pseudothauera rhizosphaerae]|uniref:Lipopolysaccharide export system permease protein LptF n=1 Tax=Pseudothauera rhizosphaerae TaxID=2565932 RepID=A0A4S4AH66_9RHOO|nr:LPS export ABC transporter permease LptF [Pseudothauera rhizosphaerae]THF58607.1 LPS export ABC transporter permease LptF [Pseudothauera rhizosphaerae]
MIFRRALQREFAHSAAAVFVALFAILITTVLIRMLGDAAGGKIPSDAVLALIGFGALARLPVVLSLTVFIAVLMSLSRSYRDSEMVVWFAAGVPLTAWIRPVLRFAVPLVAVVAAATLFLSPWAERMSIDYRDRLESRDDSSRVSPGVFRESAGAQRVFFVEVGAGEGEKVKNVFVSSEGENGRHGVIVSAEGSVLVDEDGDRYVVLEQGRRYEGVPGTAEYRVMEFDRYSVLVEPRAVAGRALRTRAMPTAELLAEPDARNLGELLGRIGMPVAALLLALLAIPLSFVNPRAGRTNNLIVAVLTYLIYSNAVSICQAWVARGRIPFEAGVLLPHLVVVMLLALMFYRRLAVSPFWRARA